MARADQRVLPKRYQGVPRTLCFLINEGAVLLLHGSPKKRIWPNKYNGLGGHVEANEDIYSAARREIAEEAGQEAQELKLCGVINIEAEQNAVAGILLFVFSAIVETRQVRPSDEGELEWVPLDQVGQLDLVEDLPTILPLVLAAGPADPPFFARYSYDEDDRLRITFADGKNQN